MKGNILVETDRQLAGGQFVPSESETGVEVSPGWAAKR